MKVWKKLFIFVFPLFLLVLFFSWHGVYINTRIEEHGCSSSYRRYVVPRFLCQKVTSNHCPTTEFYKLNAERETALCLCDIYLESPDEEIAKSIVGRCDKGCQSIIMNMSLSSGVSKDSLENADFLCKNREEVFPQLYID